MPTLKKTKSFTVSENRIEVDFNGTICECANLLKSGIKNKSIVLVAYGDLWHEIDCRDLGGDESDLNKFKSHVEMHYLSLEDLGIKQSVSKTDYDLKHDDFMELQDKFPEFDYIEISKLNDYNVVNGGKSSKYHLTEDLKTIQRDKITIAEYIEKTENQKLKIIQDIKKTTDLPIEKIPVTAEIITPEPVKKNISLQIFKTLTSDRISELSGLTERQNNIIKENPVVKITDKETYEKAKVTAAILLKASTSIDGSTGIEAQATKYLNTFKKMLKDSLAPIAKITRDSYNEQKEIISAWENAEEIKRQEAERVRLELIKKRTDRLFAVPFSFNGELYNIGSVYVTPKQIEESTDEEFDLIVSKGVEAKKVIEETNAANEAQAKKIAELEAELAKLRGVNPEPQTMIAETVTQEHTTETVVNSEPTEQAYKLPAQENVLLNRLDLENVEHLEKPAYQKCRGYYVRGLKDVAGLLNEIMTNPDQTIKKSTEIVKLIEILKKSV